MRLRLLCLLAAALLLAGTACGQQAPRNVILLIPDGFGPASATMARDYLRYDEGRTALAFDSLQTGAARTHAADSRITDSAAGATAYSTGHKTNNGYVATDTLERPLATLLEAAERRGMATGLVVTSRITHATPASFAAHTPGRWRENEIAAEEITKDIDVILGGGKRHFLPESEGGERTDGRNLMDEAREKGYAVVTERDAFDAVSATPMLGLFAMSHMDYEIDRDPDEQPSLTAMTRKALNLLEGDEDGFFLMAEGSRIDHAGHANDAAAHLRDALAFEDAVRASLAFARRDGETLVVVVSDHGTGGMSLGRNVNNDAKYAWRPGVLAEVESSFGPMREALKTSSPDSVLREHAGITDLSNEERKRLASAESWKATKAALRDVIGRRALVGWTSWGHTAVDVSLYAYGPGARRFRGNVENTRVGRTFEDLMGFDLDALTERMRETRTAGSE
jgi:alkaline phosphatase